MKFLDQVKKDDIWKTREKFLRFLKNDTNNIESFKLMMKNVLKKKLFNKKSHLIVSDVGCGIGWSGELFCSELDDSTLFLVDTSPEFKYNLNKKEFLTEKNKCLITYKQGTFSSLPFQNSSIDILIYNAAIHHETNLFQALEESKRVLKKNGILLISNEHFLREFEFLKCYFKKNIRLLLKIFNTEKFPQSISNAYIEYDGKLGDRLYRRKFFNKIIDILDFKKVDIIDTDLIPYKKMRTKHKLSHFIYKK